MPLQHRHGYAAGIHHGLPTGDITQPRSSLPDGAIIDAAEQVRAATHPRSVRFEVVALLRGFQPVVPHVRLSVSLAGPRPSDGAGPFRRCQDCFHPHPHPGDQAVLSSRRPAATGRQRCPSTTARFSSAPWRSMSATHSWLGLSAVNARPTRSGRVSGPVPGTVVRGSFAREIPLRPALSSTAGWCSGPPARRQPRFVLGPAERASCGSRTRRSSLGVPGRSRV